MVPWSDGDPGSGRFADRADAGRRLADRLLAGAALADPVVLALPRGGVVVAAPVARALGAPLDVLVVRKVGLPGQPEYGIGAVCEGFDGALLTDVVERVGIPSEVVDRLVHEERVELARRVRRYRGDRPLPEVAGRDVVLVDDGLATGVTAEAALRALRLRAPRRLVLAVPVGAPDTVERLSALADDVVCLHAPDDLGAVGRWYDDFAQTTDDEVVSLLGGE